MTFTGDINSKNVNSMLAKMFPERTAPSVFIYSFIFLLRCNLKPLMKSEPTVDDTVCVVAITVEGEKAYRTL